MSLDPSLPSHPLNGRFTDLQLIGSGGTARVFKARDLTNSNLVAVKILRPEVASLRSRARFDREVRIIRSLIHPNVLTLIDVGTVDEGQFEDCPFFVMPLVSGESLRGALERERQFSVAHAVRIVTGIANGLAAAHAVGIVHRDVKPENVLLEDDRILVADFGIARLSDSEGGLTSTTGVIVGTPPYMSPEQITGDRDLDQRSDIYSLGILFYELLAGTPPFTGSSSQAITSRHLIEPPPPLRVVRPDVDPALTEVIERALAKVPAGRQPSCEAFLQEISNAAITASQPRRRPAPRRRVALGVGVVVLAIAAGLLFTKVLGPPPAVDSARVLVLPLQRSGARIEMDAEERLRGALREWNGLRVVDEAESGRDVTPTISLPEVARRARATGAGLAVIGRLEERQGSIHLATSLLDVTAAPRVVRASALAWKSNSTPSESTFRSLSDSLLLPGTARGVKSRSYPAVLAFSDGMAALDEWDLSSAESAFQLATRADQNFAHAMLWLALVRTWLERPLPEWNYLVVRTRENGASSIHGSDSAKLSALGSMASGDLPGACRTWERLTVTSPADFANWYGLADCLRNDGVVVPDRSTPGGWRFRSSRNAATAAYRRALELIPGSHRSLSNKSFESVRQFMLTAMTDFKEGHNESNTLQFAGLPSWSGDSLVLQPILMSDLSSGKLPRSHRIAVVNQRRLFDSLTASWAAAFPESSDALIARAISLEMLGDERMLPTILEARKRARRPADVLFAGVAHVRMLVKRGLESRASMVAGRALADSLVSRFQTDTTVDPTVVATLAGLTGRVPLAAQLLRRGGTTSAGRTSLNADGDVLLLYAASGASKDSVGAMSERLDRLIQQQEPGNQTALRMTWIGRAATLSFPDTFSVPARALQGNGDYLLDAQLDVIRGDRARAVRSLTSIAATRTAPPGDLPLDAVCPETKTLAVAGQTRLALQWIRATLSSLSVAPPDFLLDGTVAAVLGRCLTMAADLAATAGETQLSDRWRSAAQVLRGQ